MIFVIGGSYQGKWEFVKARFGLSDAELFVCDSENVNLNARAIAHIERFALACVQNGGEPKAFWEAHRAELEDKILIADDVSCGVVPIDETLRAWREATGRANNYLASEAKKVYRVFCGLEQELK